MTKPHENLIQRLYALLDAGVAVVSVKALLERFEAECDDEHRAEETERADKEAA